jgi:integrase
MAVRKTPSGRWEARWREPGTRNLRGKTFRIKRDAERFLSEIEVAMARGTYVDPALGKTTLGEWWKQWIAGAAHLKPTTHQTYSVMFARHVLPYLGSRRLGSLKRLDIDSWVSQLHEKGVGIPTIQQSHIALRRVLQAACDSDILGRNPAAGVKTPRCIKREMRVLNPAEIERVAQAVPTRYRGLVLLLAWSGLRIGEATALRIGNLDLLRGRVQVVEAFSVVGGRMILGTTKSDKSRAVTLPAYVREALSRHVELFPPKEGGLVFTGPRGAAVNRQNFNNRVWKKALKLAGLEAPWPRVHDLRHTSVALAIQVGAHPKEIQARAGHSSIVVTMDRYGHLFPGSDEALAERLNAIADASA